MSGQIELRNGARVSYHCMLAICSALESLARDEPLALFELMKRCLIPNYRIDPLGPYTTILHKYHLINAERNLTDNESEVIFNSIKADFTFRKWLEIVNPIDGSLLVAVKWDPTQQITFFKNQQELYGQ